MEINRPDKGDSESHAIKARFNCRDTSDPRVSHVHAGKTQVSFVGKLGKEERVQRAHAGKREGHMSHANMGTEIRRGDEQHAP